MNVIICMVKSQGLINIYVIDLLFRMLSFVDAIEDRVDEVTKVSVYLT